MVRRTWFRILSILFASAAAWPQTAPVGNEEVASAIRLLEAWIDTQAAYRGLPGLSIAMVHDQRLVWARGFGFADTARKAPATEQTIYRIASHTKMFTATAILQLRDAGKLSLDDPVSKHLAWFRLAGGGSGSVTIRHLLTHTSGLPREAASPYWTDFRFPSRELVRSLLPSQSSVYPPETRWKYSNLALALAGEIVESVSGESYASYITNRILAPLGMTSSSVTLPEAHRSRLATGYGRRMPEGTREVMPFTDTAGIAPAANMSSTVEDMARFVSLWFRQGSAGGSQILAGETLREMQRIHWLGEDWKHGWGLGLYIVREGERTLVGHGGSLAGYRTRTCFDPKDKIGVIVFTNSSDGAPDEFVSQAFKYVAPAIARAAAPAKDPAPANPAWNRYVGRYRSLWSDTEILVVDGELVHIDPTTSDPKDGLLKLVPVSDNAFRLEGDRGFAALGELVRFEAGPDGAIERMKVGENYSRRLKPGER